MTFNENLCDRCPAHSQRTATKGEFTLKFCGHHAKQHEAALNAQGFKFLDQRVATKAQEPAAAAL